MRTDLEGLFANVVSALPARKADYYKFCLDEVLGHIKDVVAGKHTVQEFAEHYCLAAPIADAHFDEHAPDAANELKRNQQ